METAEELEGVLKVSEGVLGRLRAKIGSGIGPEACSMSDWGEDFSIIREKDCYLLETFISTARTAIETEGPGSKTANILVDRAERHAEECAKSYNIMFVDLIYTAGLR